MKALWIFLVFGTVGAQAAEGLGVIDGKERSGRSCKLFIDRTFDEVAFQREKGDRFWVRFGPEMNGRQAEQPVMERVEGSWSPYIGAAITFFGLGIRRVYYTLNFTLPDGADENDIYAYNFTSYKMRVMGEFIGLKKFEYECLLDPSTKKWQSIEEDTP